MVERQHVTESRLQDSLATLRLRDSALGAISQGVSIADAAGRITCTNRACEQMTGNAAEEMSGRTAGMLQGPGTNPARRKALRDAIADAVPFHGELLNYRRDGTSFWNEFSVTPVFDPHGRPTHSVGVMRDVTARRHTEAELLLASKLFEQISEGFMVTDAEGRILKVNRAFSSIARSRHSVGNRVFLLRAATMRRSSRTCGTRSRFMAFGRARSGTAASVGRSTCSDCR